MSQPERGPAVQLHPLTAAGLLLILVAGTALLTYLILSGGTRLAAQGGPPPELLAAATRQGQQAPTSTPTSMPTPVATAVLQASLLAVDSPVPTPTLLVARPAAIQPTAAMPTSDNRLILPDWVETRYWISIPAIGVEAPVMAFAPREREIDGVTVLRLPVPAAYVVAWDETSAEPGFAGNTIMTGHNNLWGAVFGDLDQLVQGDEIAIWSEYGVFTYHVSNVMLLEENGQPLEVRLANAQWLNDTLDDRLTLVSCWPRNSGTHRLIVTATR